MPALFSLQSPASVQTKPYMTASRQVVPLPQGTDPADDPAAFQERLAKPVSYPVHRVRLEHARALVELTEKIAH